ncbi:hypothetical protein EST38_g9660 [Candolleomyces aberdarensis]|uniref:Uncharacterized protein n=1 Tax=Candolleomyces aberdarensis TaxID=2316362 RepID=A0A4Q2CWU6_9AGAR|nr:hypothetical protein EST38_g14608 [Candolleomyces aberdarensis]RXW16192.1 hypothetical protein EST38_g9660 [Candolleomyces aberdarensis]
MRFINFLLSFLALWTCVAGLPAAQPSEGPTPRTVVTIGGGDGEPITFPAGRSISQRDGDGTTDVDLDARQGPAIAARIVAQGIISLVENILQRIEDDKGARSEYTQDFIELAIAQYPNYNWVICHTKHSTAFDGAQGEDWDHDHQEFPVFLGTIGYEIYWFRSGTFVREGDGGFLNWAYGGNVLDRTDNSGSSIVRFGTL